MTDFYTECETGLMTLLRTLTTYFPLTWQVSDDDAVLMQGAEYVVIVRPGKFPLTRQTEQLSIVNWEVTADLFVQFVDYKTSWAKFKTFRSVLFNLIMANPTLRDTAGVFRVDMASDAAAQYLKFSEAPDARPAYIVQTAKFNIVQLIQYPPGTSEF